MARRSGSADLPLHGGRVPGWLAQRMARLGTVIAEAIVLEYGRAEFLRRLAHPFWFQSFGAVMGMDWHSSGITTSVLGALKRGLGPREVQRQIAPRAARPHLIAAFGHRAVLVARAVRDTLPQAAPRAARAVLLREARGLGRELRRVLGAHGREGLGGVGL